MNHRTTSSRPGRLGRAGRWLLRGRLVVVGASSLLVAGAGCGSNLDDLLLQAAASVGRVVVDQAITEAANEVADAIAGDGVDSTDGEIDGGTDGSGDGGDGTGGDGDNGGGGPDLPAEGDASRGANIYADTGCASCHCADASGGCALSAPGLVGVSATVIDDALRGDAGHPTMPVLTDQEVVDLAAFLASP